MDDCFFFNVSANFRSADFEKNLPPRTKIGIGRNRTHAQSITQNTIRPLAHVVKGYSSIQKVPLRDRLLYHSSSNLVDNAVSTRTPEIQYVSFEVLLGRHRFGLSRWQRETLSMRATGQDGFLVLAGLFFVLLVENLWSFDPREFDSATAGDGFLGVLILGAACGIFSIFAVTMVRLKLQRLLARDVACLNAQQVGQALARYDRLVEQWERSALTSQFHHACLAYEWYHEARPEGKTQWNPVRPSVLAMYAVISFTVMLAALGVALGIKVADVKGMWWSVCSCALMAGGALMPVVFLAASVRAPLLLSASEDNPFNGY